VTPASTPAGVGLPAVFLDRDGTIIADRHYLRDPAGVELLPGAAWALGQLNQARIPVVVVTNQSGIGRGYFSVAEYERVAARLDELLAADGARIDASYMCPHAPDAREPCACRKPGVLLYERAIADHGLDGAASFFVGDMWRDIVPARAFGGRGILIPTDKTPREERDRAAQEAEIAPSLTDATARILAALGSRGGRA
jgi:D-glycero-D-manno-heptose 1,7-bisphosphate phosphatase